MKKYILKIVVILVALIVFCQNFVYADMIVTPIETGTYSTYFSIPFLLIALGMLGIIYFIFVHYPKKKGNISQEQFIEKKSKSIKALKIILMVWIIGIAFFSFFFSMARKSGHEMELMPRFSDVEIDSFNSSFLPYGGKRKGNLVKFLINEAKSKAKQYENTIYGHEIEIDFFQKTPIEETIHMSSSQNNFTTDIIQKDKNYLIDFEYNEEGFINKVKIEEIIENNTF